MDLITRRDQGGKLVQSQPEIAQGAVYFGGLFGITLFLSLPFEGRHFQHAAGTVLLVFLYLLQKFSCLSFQIEIKSIYGAEGCLILLNPLLCFSTGTLYLSLIFETSAPGAI